MMLPCRLARIAGLLALITCAAAAAEVPAAGALEFSAIVGDGVLQHGEPTAVWGVGAQGGAAVVVTLHTQPPATVHTVANAGGSWSLQLPAQPVAWHVPLTALSDGAAANTTVSFGKVVLCAGQSNMDMPVACHLTNKTACFTPKLAFHADNGTAEVAAAGLYANKIFMQKAVNQRYNHAPAWQTASSETGMY